MKKLIVTLIAVITVFMSTVSLAADDGRGLNVFAGMGFALEDFDGLCLIIGGEMQISEKFYAQLLFDYYPNVFEMDVVDVGNSAYGINLYGVFKQPLSDRFKLFAKAGVHYTVLENSVQFSSVYFTKAESKIGVGGGFGGEYALNEKWSLLLGATVKLIFADETGTWFKVYSGISYRLN